MRSRAFLLLALILAGLSLGALIAQAPFKERFPGAYPTFEAPIEGKFTFTSEGVEITVAETTKSGRLIVFAYEPSGRMVGILKPMEQGRLVVRPGDLADFEVQVEGKTVKGFSFLKRMDRYAESVDMAARLRQASDQGLRFGIQRCLHPFCSRCTSACASVISGGDLPITLNVAPSGHIHPSYAKGKCPRCGMCFTWCPSGLITQTHSLTGGGAR